ncbi:MAG: Hsp20/alpha crystallin family protein [Candidatus Xenobia bacterium]
MTNLSVFEPLRDTVSLREAVNRLFEDSFVRPEMLVGGNRMPMDVVENGEAILVKVNLPGCTREQVEIHFQKDTLTIKAHIGEPAKAEAEPKERFLLRERFSGTLSRTLTLPFPMDVEKASAKYENGVLLLTLPKSEAAKPKTIKVTE